MSTDWTASDVFDGGTSFGDEQYGTDLTRRYTRTAPDGTLLTVDYLVAVMAREPVEEDPDRSATAYWVDERTDYSQGTTEEPESLWWDTEYGQGSYRSYTNPEDAQEQAVRMMNNMSSDYIDWDGM